MKQSTVWMKALLVLGVLAVCQPAGAWQESNENGSPPKSGSPAPARPAAPAPVNLTTDYRVGVSDVLEVHVWKEPELTRIVTVRPDGKVSLPLVGELVAEGKTAPQLREVVTKRLSEYVSAPEVTVIVQQINRLRYFVIGEVTSPGAYPLTAPVTLTQALAMAGGFKEWADKGKIMIQRRAGGGKTVRIYFNYKAWVKNTWQYENIDLVDGDVIVVP